MKKMYNEPIIEIIELNDDIIVTSQPGDNYTNMDEFEEE